MPNTPTRTSSSHRIEEEEQIHSPRSPITPLSSLSHHHSITQSSLNNNNEESSSPALTPTSFRKYESSPFSKATTTSSGSHTMAMMDVSVENKITPPSIKTPPSLFEVSTHSVQKIGQPHPFISPSESVYADRLRYHQHVSSSSHQTLSPFQRRERIFKDEIHSHISFPTSICKQVIDTESFQRLRDLKQLGSCYYVFPGASHNRFEHCLGVGHLSKKWIDKLFMNRQDYYWGVSGHGSMGGGGGGNGGGHGSMGGGGSGTFSTPNRDGSSDHERPTYKDIYILQVAALCHDLGHGPFSHVFDNEFIPRVKKQNSIMDSIPWTHEMGSKTMFKYMLDENTNDVKNYGDLNENTVLGLNAEEVEHLSEQFIGVPSSSSSSQQVSSSHDMAIPTTTLSYDHDIQFIDFGKEECDMVFNMIDGHISKNEFSQNRQYLYQIVANKKNSVDVDKFDYLARDCQNLGLISSYDSSRLMEFSRIIHGNICFSSKEVYNLYEMFHTRYNLHKQVYTHRVGKSVEYMITDALVEADPHLHISEMIHCPEQYVHLSDSILYKIETSTNPELSKSRQILKRLKRRDLYKFVDEVLLPLDRFEEIKKDVCEEEIASCAPNIAGYGHLETCLHPSDIIIHNMSINYSMKDKNPVDQCLFYKSTFGSDDDEPFHIAKEQVSYLIPSQFMERYVRLFVRDANKLDIAYAAFQNWIQKKKLKKSSNSLE